MCATFHVDKGTIVLEMINLDYLQKERHDFWGKYKPPLAVRTCLPFIKTCMIWLRKQQCLYSKMAHFDKKVMDL